MARARSSTAAWLAVLVAACAPQPRVVRRAPPPACEQRGELAVYDAVPTDPDGTGALDGDTLCVAVRGECQRDDPRASLACHLAYFLKNGRHDYYGVACPAGGPARTLDVRMSRAYWKPGHETACWQNLHVSIACAENCAGHAL